METSDNGNFLQFNENPLPFNGNPLPFMETIFENKACLSEKN
jgi:hypothetical protein